MVAPTIVSSITSYLAAVDDPKHRFGLMAGPATPWYLGQANLKGDLLPGFYKSGINPEYEREVLRDYRLSVAEFSPTRGLPDQDVMISAHMNALPSRIVEWTSNPLVALFLAVESLSNEPGRIWILNPWILNAFTSEVSFVPIVESAVFMKYVVMLDDGEAPTQPLAILPMAFRPTRTTRNYNLQNTYWIIYGKGTVPIDELTFFMKRADEYLTFIHVAADSKKTIMRGLHDIGMTRSNLFPGAASLTRTLAYRYSKNYLG